MLLHPAWACICSLGSMVGKSSIWTRPYPFAMAKVVSSIFCCMDGPVLADIDALLAKKRAAPEMGLDMPVPSIAAFIEAELARLEIVTPERVQRTEVLPQLNGVFHRTLAQAWRED